jgi:hypothetical protein
MPEYTIGELGHIIPVIPRPPLKYYEANGFSSDGQFVVYRKENIESFLIKP